MYCTQGMCLIPPVRRSRFKDIDLYWFKKGLALATSLHAFKESAMQLLSFVLCSHCDLRSFEHWNLALEFHSREEVRLMYHQWP